MCPCGGIAHDLALPVAPRSPDRVPAPPPARRYLGPEPGPRARPPPRPPSPLSPSRLGVRPSVRLRPVRMRLVSGMRAHARPRFAAVLRTEDTGRARAARREAADRGEQIRGEIDAQAGRRGVPTCRLLALHLGARGA